MRNIVQDEASRRRALYEAGKVIFAPIISVIETAARDGARVSLTLRPPSAMGSSTVEGTLLCRSFHDGVGRRRRRYQISISPDDGLCQINLDCSALSDEEYEASRDDPNLVWGSVYWVKGREPSIKDLEEMIQEALMTDAVEQQGGLERLRIPS